MCSGLSLLTLALSDDLGGPRCIGFLLMLGLSESFGGDHNTEAIHPRVTRGLNFQDSDR